MYGFQLARSIRPGSRAGIDDVLKARSALNRAGVFKSEDDERLRSKIDRATGLDIFDGIRRFQRDHGLKVDGVINPHGPTERRLQEVLGEREPSARRRATDVSRTTDWFRSHKARPLPDKAVAANRRILDHLLRSTVNGGLPALFADTLRKGPKEKPIAELADFLRQMNARSPKRVPGFQGDILALLPLTVRPQVEQSFTKPGLRTMEYRKDRDGAVTVRNLPAEDRGPIKPTLMAAVAEPRNESKSNTRITQNEIFNSSMAGSNERTKTPALFDRLRHRLESGVLNTVRAAHQLGADAGDLLGLDQSSEFLKHFLNGSGEPLKLSREEARQNHFVREAEVENRTRFETKTFLGRTEKTKI